ncbi:MAG: hypothetical protein AB8G17_13925 [Gammaproteobacteria bacterium]
MDRRTTAAYVTGAVTAFAANSGWQPEAIAWLFPSLLGLLVSIATYLVACLALRRAGIHVGLSAVRDTP